VFSQPPMDHLDPLAQSMQPPRVSQRPTLSGSRLVLGSSPLTFSPPRLIPGSAEGRVCQISGDTTMSQVSDDGVTAVGG
jgi:hypothetical protein